MAANNRLFIESSLMPALSDTREFAASRWHARRNRPALRSSHQLKCHMKDSGPHRRTCGNIKGPYFAYYQGGVRAEQLGKRIFTQRPLHRDWTETPEERVERANALWGIVVPEAGDDEFLAEIASIENMDDDAWAMLMSIEEPVPQMVDELQDDTPDEDQRTIDATTTAVDMDDSTPTTSAEPLASDDSSLSSSSEAEFKRQQDELKSWWLEELEHE